MSTIIKGSDILSGEVMEFKAAKPGIVDVIEKGRMKIIFYNGLFLDFFGNVLTKVNLYTVDESYAALDIEVRENTLYVDGIRPYEEVTEQDLYYAAKAIEVYKTKKSLIEEGKIIPFPNKVIH